MSASWEETLDALGTRMKCWRKVVEGGPPPADVEWPATDLPPHLAERAKELLSEYEQLEGAFATRSDELRSAIRLRRASRPARSPLYLDRRV